MALVFDAVYNSEGVMRGVRESQRAFAELRSSAENEGIRIDNAFKKQIYEGSQSVNALTGKIINQKKTVRSLTKDIDTLTESYKKVSPDSVKGKDLFVSLTNAKSMLKNKKEELLELQTQQAQVRLSVRKLRDEYSLYQKEGQNVVESNNNMALSFKKTLAAIGGVAAIKQFVSEVLKVRGQFQQLDVAFTTLLQSKKKANALMAQMVETAAKTPFNLTELATGAKQLVAYGFASEGVNDTLIRLGNIASGLGLPLERLTYLYGTTMTQGRLYARDLMQFTTSGIPMLQGLADMYGVSTDKVNEMVTAGKIGFPEVQKVIENMTNEGGKFFNLMEEQSKTITGKISNLGDAWDEMLNKIGQSQEGVINNSIDGLKYLVENYEKIGQEIFGLVTAYGAYKAAIIVLSVVERARYTATLAMGAAEKTLTAWQAIRFAATEKLTVAQKALNAAMLKNPYVLIGVAVAGLTYGIYKLATAETVAEKAARQHREEQEKFQKTIDERKQRIEELIRIIQDETETEYAKAKAYDELQKLSPALTSAYTREQLAVASLTDTNKKLNEERDKNNYDNIISNVNKYTETLSKARKEAEKLREDAKNEEDSEKAANLSNLAFGQDMAAANAERNLSQWQKDLDEYNRIKKEAKESAKTVEVKLLEAKSSRDQIVQEYAAAKLTLEEEQRKIQESGFGVIPIDVQIRFDNAKAQLANIGATIASLMQGKTDQTYKEAYNTAQKEWKAAQKALEESKKKSKADYDKAKNDLAEKEKAYKDLGGSTNTSKQESAAEKLRKEQEKLALLMDKQALDQSRSSEDLQTQVDEARINAMKDGSKKTIAQMELNFEKEMQVIDRQKEDSLRKKIEGEKAKFDVKENENAAKDSKHVKQTFDPTGIVLSDDENKQYDDLYKAKIAEKEKEEKAYLDSLLEKHQDYTDQRLAIETKYNADIAALEEQRIIAVKNGDTNLVERIDRAKAQATKNKGKELMSMDYDKLKESPEYVRAFENLKETSSETLNSLLTQLENAKGTAAQVLSPDQLREYTTTIQEIMDELDSRNPFQSLSDKKQELAEAEQELAQAQIELENARQTAEAVKGGVKIENGISSSKFNSKTGKIESTKAYLSEAQALDKVKQKTEDYNVAKDKVSKTNNKVKKSEKEVRDQIDELSQSINELGKSIGGPAGEIISLIGEIGTFAMTAMSGVQAAADTSATAISTVEKASVILMVISAAVQLATKMLDLFGGDDTTEKYEKTKEAYESYINILDQVIDKQLEMAESLSGASAQAAYDKAIEFVKTQSAAAKVLGKQYLNSGASWKSRSKGYKEVEDMSSSGWADGAKALGMSVDDFKKKMGGRMEGLFDLTDEQLVKLQSESHVFWAQLDDDTKDYANQIVEGVAQVGEILEQQITDVTGISFDSLVDNFKSALSDMNSTAEDFAEDFEQYMMNAIINSFINGDEFKKKLKDWHNKFAEYSKSNNEIDANEKEQLKKDWDIIVQDGIDYRNGVMESMGFDSSKSSSQNSTTGSFEAMSQDTGTELNGRFTALQVSNEEIKNSMLAMLTGVNLLSTSTTANGITLMEIRNLAISSNSHLEDIARFTKPLLEVGGKLDRIESNTKGLTKR